MDQGERLNRAGLALAALALAGVVLALLALLDIWPFNDAELTEAEFIAQGDEICREAHDEFLDLQESTPRTPSDAEELTETLIEVAEEERDAIADLREPDSLSDQVERYLEVRDEGIDLLREGLAAAEDADTEAYEELQAEVAATQLDPRYEIAGEIGFQECSKPLVSRGELRRDAEPPGPSDPDAPPTVNNPPTGAP